MYFPSRGGVRGGQDQFNWDDIKTDKFRENYLGHSVKAPVGRWQKGKDLTWYARDKNNAEARRETIAKLKMAEADAIDAALGHKQIKKDHYQLSKEELAEALKRGQIERSSLDVERIEGFGYSGARASKSGPSAGMSFYMPNLPPEKRQAKVENEEKESKEQIKINESQSTKKSKHSSKKKSSKHKKKSKKQKSKRQPDDSSPDGQSSNTDDERSKSVTQPRFERSSEDHVSRTKDKHRDVSEEPRRDTYRSSKHEQSRDRRSREYYSGGGSRDRREKRMRKSDLTDSEGENKSLRNRKNRRDSSSESESESRNKSKRERKKKRFDSTSD